MGKYQKQTVIYCLLFAASTAIGQAAKTFHPSVPLVAYFAGFVFVILAAINATKAYQKK